MKIVTLLIMMTLNSAIAAIETYICHGKEETYTCDLYTGGDLDVYEYPKSFNKINISVYEFSDAGTRNPDAPSDNESGVTDDENNGSISPVFIPYNPAYLFPFFDIKK
jgi:hypothetical protein